VSRVFSYLLSKGILSKGNDRVNTTRCGGRQMARHQGDDRQTDFRGGTQAVDFMTLLVAKTLGTSQGLQPAVAYTSDGHPSTHHAT
jgi:hypothetical protein